MASFTEELIESQSKLRSLALLYKELKNRHDPGVEAEERIHKLILSGSKTSIFYKDPDKQAEYQEKLLEKLSDPPQIPKTPLFADKLLEEYLSISSPISVKSLRSALLEHFQARFRYLAHYKFKLLLKWAHLQESGEECDISEELENLQFSFSDAYERYQRLQDDGFFNENPKRPIPKTVDNTNLYLHASNLEYCNISRDDIKHFIEHSVETSQKTQKFKIFLNQAKNLGLCQKWQIWEDTISKMLQIKNKSVERMKILTGNDLDSAKNFLKSFRRPFKKGEIFGQEQEIEMPPLCISDITQLQLIVSKISKEFGLKGEMELDDGHSLAYQVTHLFPELFELQKLKLDWVEYGNSQARQMAFKRIENLHFMKSYRVTFIRKSSSCSETDVPVLKSFNVAYLKKTDWFHLINFKIKTPGWMQKQLVRLKKLGSLSSELQSTFQLIDQQDIGQANRIIEDGIVNYQISQKFQDNDMQKEDEIKNNKKYFSILLAENIEKVQTSQLKIPVQMIKTYYLLVLLKNRKMKNRIIDLLNGFRSIQRRVVIDLNDLELREDFFGVKVIDIKKLQGRWDFINEVESEVYVKDGNNEYVVYDCVLEDYNEISKQLILLGTFYIEKYLNHSEQLDNGIDMSALASELLELEYEYQLSKYNLISTFLHFYNNSIDKSVQEKLAYRILKTIAQRPKLNLKSTYFYESYKSHIESFNSQTNMLNAIIQSYPPEGSLITPINFNLEDLLQLLSNTSKSLFNTLTIESPKQHNFLDSVIWDYSLKLWKFVDRNNSASLSAGILLDKPDLIGKLILSALNDLKTGKKLKPPLMGEENLVIDEIHLYCNYFKLWKLKEVLGDYLEESKILNDFYVSQALLGSKEVQNVEQLNWETKFHPQVDEGPGTHTVLNLACSELDKSLMAFMNFSDINSTKYLLLPWGMDELICIIQYQVMHNQCLSLSTRLNQAYSDIYLRTLSELNLYTKYSFVPNHHIIDWKDYMEPKGVNREKLEKFKQRTFLLIQKFFCSCFTLKNRNRVQALEKYKISVHLQGKGKKDKDLAMLARRIRVNVIGEYCFSVLQDLYPLAFKVQILAVLDSYKKLASVIPTASYKYIYKGTNFYDSDRGLFDFSVFPTVQYIVDYPCKYIEDLSKEPCNTDSSKSILHYKYNWNLSHDLLKILQTLICLVQSLHIRLFLNFLSIPSEEILQLWESIEHGEAFFNSEKSNALEQTSETLIEDQITEAFSLVKILNENQISVEKDERVRYFILFAKQNFDILTISILTTYHYVRTNNKIESSKDVLDVKGRALKYRFVDFLNGKFKVAQVEEQVKRSSLLQCGYISQLDWVFSSLSASERSRGFTVAIAVQLKTENFLRSFTVLNKMHEIKSLLEFLKTDIMLLRLKYNFYLSQTGEYEAIQEVYRNLIEEKADILVSDVTSRKDLAKVNAEIKVLKEFFLLEICKEGSRVLEITLKQINSAAESDEPFSVIIPEKHSPDYLKKVNLFTSFLNLLKNRGTIVQAPGGKAVVYTIKDLSNIISRFADQSFRYKDCEKREYLEKTFKQISLLKTKLKEKRKNLLGYQKKKTQLQKEVSDMVTARITQKGAQFMYEIDISQRQLKEIKENSHALEVQVREKLTIEYLEKYKNKVEEFNKLQETFSNFQTNFSSGLQKSIDKLKNEGLGSLKKISNYSEKEEEKSNADGGGKNNTLVVLQNTIRKLREKYQWKRLREMRKFQTYIHELREQLTSNVFLIDQLKESKSREDLLKKELHYTKVSLASSEKLEAKLKQQIREMKVQEESLQRFKEVNSKKINEMQQRVSKFKSFKEIDEVKIEKEKNRQTKILKTLGHAEQKSEDQYKNFHNSYARQILKLKELIFKEKQILSNCEKLILVTRGEIEGVEHYEESEWKRRYYELLTEHKEKRGFKIISSRTPQKMPIKRSGNAYFKTPQKSNKSFY